MVLVRLVLLQLRRTFLCQTAKEILILIVLLQLVFMFTGILSLQQPLPLLQPLWRVQLLIPPTSPHYL